MSRLWKSELRLRVGHEHCDLGLWQGAPWKRECVLQLRAPGTGRAGIDAALGQCAASGADLPEQARLVIDDDCVFFALLEAGLRWSDARERAERHFNEALGLPDLQIELALAPGGRHWIAAAMAGADLDGWLDALDERQIMVTSVRLALLEDLQQVRRQLDPDTAVLAMVREHGAMVLGLDRGGLDRMSWERVDWHDAAELLARLGAQRQDGAATTACLIPATRAQHLALEMPGRQAGWQVLPALMNHSLGVAA